MTYRMLTKHRGKFLAIATALWSADSFTILGTSLQLGCSSDSKACTDMGCLSDVTMHILATSWPLNGEVPTISVCRGTKCISGNLDLPDAGPSIRDGAGVSFSFPFPNWNAAQSLGSDYAGVTVTPMSAFSSKVDISYFPYVLDLADGDHYTVTLSNDNAAPLTYEQTVTYTNSYPNGPDCDPFPCRNADVTLSEAGM
jgi:hypothetical protein